MEINQWIRNKRYELSCLHADADAYGDEWSMLEWDEFTQACEDLEDSIKAAQQLAEDLPDIEIQVLGGDLG